MSEKYYAEYDKVTRRSYVTSDQGQIGGPLFPSDAKDFVDKLNAMDAEIIKLRTALQEWADFVQSTYLGHFGRGDIPLAEAVLKAHGERLERTLEALRPEQEPSHAQTQNKSNPGRPSTGNVPNDQA